ncbi:MAG: AbrB/MazE/SpoVT family DNA-binding domain-containing protein, partial [Mesorhizobium sp.]
MAGRTGKSGFDEDPQARFDADARQPQLRVPTKRERVKLGEGGRFV